jgi:ATP-dependent DNA helicase RecG
VEGSIIEQVEETVEFIKKNLHVRFEITGAPQRKEIWDYPLPALREAVINAIVHRDYGDTADIQIKIFEDVLQVWSPGFLPYNVTVKDLFDPQHTSKPRNKLIAQIFYDMGLIERYGSGIHRILEACQEADLPEPLFENFSGGFRIKFTLPKQSAESIAPQVTPQVTPQVRALIESFEGEMPRDVLMSQLSLKDREHFRKEYLIPALEAGLIEMTIPDKPKSSKQKYRLTEAGRLRITRR